MDQKPNDDRVRIVQLLCGPLRHAIFAIAYLPGMSAQGSDDNDVVLTTANAAAYMAAMVNRWLKQKTIGDRCGLCDAPAASWVYEDRATKFQTMEEALPQLRASERANLQARDMIGGAHRN